MLVIFASFLEHCFKDLKNLFMRETEAETQAEGEAGSLQGAQCGTGSWDSGIMTWAEGRRSNAEPPRLPTTTLLKK